MVVIPYHFRSKDELRKWLWKYLSDYHLTMVPRPCFARIPSFRALEVATARLTEEPAWHTAATVVITADDVTLEARREALRAGKTVLVPVPRTHEAWRLEAVSRADAQVAAMLKEIDRFAKRVPLARLAGAPLLVTGAVSVDRYGNWLGQGEVFGETPSALMQSGGMLDECTRIALVDDKQIFEDFGYLTEAGDLPVQLIVTKTQTLAPKSPEERPRKDFSNSPLNIR
ncbi:MAG: hypothetical protein OEW11_05805 [Nitrospirota bacterium]|nr:hypothetical protein [Nitrospirota bacterium]